MLIHRPSRRRPPLSAPRGQLRAAYRLSAGLSPAAVARAEAVAEREITALLAQPDFQELVEALEELQGLPEEERLRRLERLAWCVLEMALADSDWRAAAFVADQLRRGYNPARMLAKGVLKARARAATPPPPPTTTATATAEPTTPPPPRAARPYDPVGAAIGRATAGLRTALALETALAHAPDRPATAATTHPAAATEPAAPARSRAARTLWPRGCAPAAPPRPPPTTTRAVSCARGRKGRNGQRGSAVRDIAAGRVTRRKIPCLSLPIFPDTIRK